MALSTCESVLDALPAYSLDALDASERAQVEAHLEHCLACRAEMAGLAETAVSLGALVPQVQPPARLRANLLAAAESRGRSPMRPNAATWRAYLTSAAALVAVGSLAWVVALQGQLNAQQATLERLSSRSERYERIVSVLSSPSMVMAELRGDVPAPSAQGRVIVDPHQRSGMLMVWDLPPVPEDRAYQVWFVSESSRASGGLVRPNERGAGYFFVQVPEDLSNYRAIGLTLEPAQGSPGPTGPRVLGGELQ